jgi:hypothetical protein
MTAMATAVIGAFPIERAADWRMRRERQFLLLGRSAASGIVVGVGKTEI